MADVADNVVDSIYLIDGTSSVVSIDGGFSSPKSVVFSPDGIRVFIANAGATADRRSVSVINTATNALVYTVNDSNIRSQAPTPMVVSPDGSLLSVANSKSTNILVYRISDDTYADKTFLTAAHTVNTMAISFDGNTLYNAPTSSPTKTINALNVATNTNTYANISNHIGGGVALNPAGTGLYGAAASADTRYPCFLTNAVPFTQLPLPNGSGLRQFGAFVN